MSKTCYSGYMHRFSRRFVVLTCLIIGAFFAHPAAAAQASCPDVANPDRQTLVNAAYLAIWGRDARCDELAYHVTKETSLKKLRSWLRSRAEAWYADLSAGPLKGQTVSTGRHEWFFVSGGELHRIPDWPTALAWGLLIDDRREIPIGMTDAFYRLAPLGRPLNFSDGPYAAAIHNMWKKRKTLPSSLPPRLKNEISRLSDNGSYGNIFLINTYVPRSGNDASAKLLDWAWLAGNPANFRIAFFGDQGNTSNSQRVLNLVRNEKADMAIHLGDFDYKDDPDAWDALVTQVLGENFPYFALIGNHDVAAWAGYQQKIVERIARIPDAACTGDLGVKASCRFRNMSFVLSGVGTLGSDHEAFLTSSLSAFPSSWKICAWHKDQRLMQVGEKGDEVGWDAYDICRRAGAIIATAHEHSYSRTYLLSNFSQQTVASTSSTLALRPGYSFAFVAGLGGHSIREQNDALAANPWWAAVDTATQNAAYGALFCDMNLDGNPYRASCYFKNIRDEVRDRFEMTRQP